MPLLLATSAKVILSTVSYQGCDLMHYVFYYVAVALVVALIKAMQMPCTTEKVVRIPCSLFSVTCIVSRVK